MHGQGRGCDNVRERHGIAASGLPTLGVKKESSRQKHLEKRAVKIHFPPVCRDLLCPAPRSVGCLRLQRARVDQSLPRRAPLATLAKLQTESRAGAVLTMHGQEISRMT